MASRIEDYALIGDCETAALVSRDGSIDWLCFPRFDSAACFASLLGMPENGRWRVTPRDGKARISRRYRPDTLILETSFETDGGAATLIDFMPLRDGASDLVRLVVGQRGQVEFVTDFVVRFDYGRTVPWVTREDDGAITAVAGPDRLVLQTPVVLDVKDLHSTGAFTVSAGERVPFILTYAPSNSRRPPHQEVDAALASTEAFWRDFSSRCPPVGPWTHTVKRSLITLKALTYMPTGGIVAAATTSLPEQLGGTRNWDYRFCWLRDATMTLQAFMKLGYYEEASAWREWLMRAVAGAPEQMQIMYGVSGERHLLEWEASWLQGYERSRPVRIGNAAAEQWGEAARPADYFDLKGDLEALAAVAGARLSFTRSSAPHGHPGRSADVLRDGVHVGWIGELHPRLLRALDIDQPVVAFELDAEALQARPLPRLAPLSKFPSVRRDLAIVAPEAVEWAALEATVRAAAGPLLSGIRLFDRYAGKGVESGFRSLAMGLILQENSRTLTDRDVDAVVADVVAALGREHGAALRS